VWEDWRKGAFNEKDKKEKPKDINKDFPDIHRYVAAAKLDYNLLLGENQAIVQLNGRSNTSNPYLERQRPSPIELISTGYRKN